MMKRDYRFFFNCTVFKMETFAQVERHIVNHCKIQQGYKMMSSICTEQGYSV